jgi:protein SCO1/2
VEGYRLALAALVLAVGACERAPAIPEGARIELSDQFSSDFDLIDTKGDPARDEDFRGKTMIVYFGFASCPDVCPLALSRLSAALAELSDTERASLVPVFITVDPERDTPEALARFLAFEPALVGLTGSKAAVDAARASFKVFARKTQNAGSALGYSVDHSSFFFVVDRTGRVEFALNDDLTPQELAAVLRRTVRRN